MPDLIILGVPPSTYVRTAQLVCRNKEVEATLQPVDFRSDAYRASHPFNRMPALEHGEVRLYEALAIATYIDEAFDGPALTPDTPVGRAEMLQWISVINDYIYDDVVRKCVSERFVKPMRGLEPDEAVIAGAMPDIVQSLQVLDAALKGRKFLVGDTLTLADMFLSPILVYFAATPEGKALMPDLPALSAWLDRMAQTPGHAEINRLG